MMIKQQQEPLILVNAECLLKPKICSFRHESKTGSPNGNSLFDSDSTLDTTFTCTTTTTDSTHQQMVRFSVVQRREYSVTLGDHSLPDCFPLSLDWSHTQEQEASLDDYERSREKSRLVPLLNSLERCERISNVTGLSMDELEAQEINRLIDLEMEKLLMEEEPEQVPELQAQEEDYDDSSEDGSEDWSEAVEEQDSQGLSGSYFAKLRGNKPSMPSIARQIMKYDTL
jgi:hypothetical protein